MSQNDQIMDFRKFRMLDLRCTEIVEIFNFRIFRRSQKPSGPGYPRKHCKRFNMDQKGTSRTTLGCYFIKYRPKRGRRPKAAALFWERPKAATIFDEKASKKCPEGIFLTNLNYFDVFCLHSGSDSFRQFPKSSKIVHAYSWSTFWIGYPKCTK